MGERREGNFRYNLTSVRLYTRQAAARRRLRRSVIFLCWLLRTQRAFKERVHAPGGVLAAQSQQRFEAYAALHSKTPPDPGAPRLR